VYAYLSMEDVYSTTSLIRDTKVPFNRTSIFKEDQFKRYIENTKISLLLEKLMELYITDTTPCQQNTIQMFVLADTIFLVFSLDPYFVKKMLLVAFCIQILENNHTNGNVVLSANIHVMLLNTFSEHQHADDRIQRQPAVITSLCQKNTNSTFER